MLAYKISFTIVEDLFPEVTHTSYFLSKREAQEEGRRFVEGQEGGFTRDFHIKEILIIERQ